MPRADWNRKRERQYDHIKEGLIDRGEREEEAEEIAARTVNKVRARSGEAESASRSSLDDISSASWGTAFTQRQGWKNTRSALPGSPEDAHQRSVDNVKDPTGAGGWPLSCRRPVRALGTAQADGSRRATRSGGRGSYVVAISSMWPDR